MKKKTAEARRRRDRMVLSESFAFFAVMFFSVFRPFGRLLRPQGRNCYFTSIIFFKLV